MFQWGCVSAANLSWQKSSTTVDMRNGGNLPSSCFQLKSRKMDSLAFGYGEFLARGLRIPFSQAVGRRQKKGVSPLKVCFVCSGLFSWSLKVFVFGML